MKYLPFIVALAAALAFAPVLSQAQQPNDPDKPFEEPAQPEPPQPTPPAPPDDETPEPPPPQPDQPEIEYTMMTATDPQTVLDALNLYGFRGSLEPTSTGRPRIRFAVSGSTTSIIFYDCKKDLTGCRTLQFLYGIDLEDGARLSDANEWNSKQVWGRVYLDGDGDPWLDLMVNTGDVLPQVRFKDYLDNWELLVGKFKSEMS